MVVVLQENEKTLSPKLIEIKGVRALFYMISLSKSSYLTKFVKIYLIRVIILSCCLFIKNIKLMSIHMSFTHAINILY